MGKFLLVAFLGVHVPLIGVLVYVALRSAWSTAVPVLVVALLATLIGSALTLYVQNALLAPVLESSRALDTYVNHRTLPDLPDGYSDEAGLLMRNTQECITHLAALVALKNDLLATLAHDARSPLTSIQLASRLGRLGLGSGDSRAEVDEMFTLIDSAAARQLELMNSMLLTALADSGRLDLKLVPLRMDELVQKVTSLFMIQAKEKGVTLCTSVAPAAEIELDASKTEQVLANLINNAIKFTPEGGTIEVAVIAEGDDTGFSVADSGIGIPDLMHAKLFEREAGNRRDGTRREGGTGLGLWICRTFTELQGGTISFASSPGGGTRFDVRFTATEVGKAWRARIIPQG